MLKVYLPVTKDGETYLEPKLMKRKEALRLVSEGKAFLAEPGDQQKDRVERLGEKNAALLSELEEAFGGYPDEQKNIDAAWDFPGKPDANDEA